MATFRFLHCADLHLDSPLRGLETDPNAPADRIRGATREAFSKLVDYVIAERLDFVVAAGDLYDGDWQDWRTGHFLIGQIARLAKANIPFVAIRGNHDAANVMTRHLHFPGDNSWLLDEKKPQSVRLPNVPVSIHGQSFATREVKENLSRNYPPPDLDRFNIGLLHTSAGEREGHDTYASCSIDDLRDRDYQYWALGHVHKREILASDPWIVFPGNLQGRKITETGPKGATLVTATDREVVDVTPIVFDTVRWAHIRVDLTPDADEDAALSQVRFKLADALEQAEGRLLAVRITLSGACAAHDAFSHDLGAARERIRAEALAVAGPDVIWTEKIDIATRPQIATHGESQDASGQLIRVLRDTDGTAIEDDIRAYATRMLERANAVRQASEGGDSIFDALKEDQIADLVRRARDLLLSDLEG